MASSRAAPPSGEAPPALTEAEEEELAAERYPRNKFLELTTLGLGAVIGGVVTLPIVGFAILPAFTDQEREGVDLGPTDNFPENEWREATYLLDPAQGEVSCRTAFVRYNGLYEDLPSYTIISNRCVHLGCPGPGERSEKRGREGDREHRTGRDRPDSRAACQLQLPLPAAPTTPRGTGSRARRFGLWIGSSSRSRTGASSCSSRTPSPRSRARAQGKLKTYGIQGPGEHVDGLSGWLYPIQPQDLR